MAVILSTLGSTAAAKHSNLKHAQLWHRWRDYARKISVGRNQNKIAFHSLSRDPKVVFVNLEELSRDTIGPLLDPPGYPSVDIDAIQGHARFHVAECLRRMATDLGHWMLLSSLDAGLDVGERLAGGSRQREAKAQLSHRDCRDELRRGRVERRYRISNC